MLEVLKCTSIGIVLIVAVVSALGGFVWAGIHLEEKFYEPNKHRVPRWIPFLGKALYACALAGVILYSIYNLGRSVCQRPKPHSVTRGDCGPS
jgi:hypothetical protein